MVPKRYEHYLFNDNDYLPEHYEVADKEREELIRQLAAMIFSQLSSICVASSTKITSYSTP